MINLLSHRPFSEARPVEYPPASSWDSVVLALLLQRLQDPQPIDNPFQQVILPFAQCSERLGDLLVSPVGGREKYLLSDHIQMFFVTLEQFFGSAAPELRFLLRLYALLHDCGKPWCLIRTKDTLLQAGFNLEFLEEVFFPAVDALPNSPITEAIKQALRLLCSQDILGRGVQYETRSPEWHKRGRFLSALQADMEIETLVNAFPVEFRTHLAFILKSLFLSDVRAYTTYVGYTTIAGVYIPNAPGRMNGRFHGTDNLTLAEDRAQPTLDRMLQVIERLVIQHGLKGGNESASQ